MSIYNAPWSDSAAKEGLNFLILRRSLPRRAVEIMASIAANLQAIHARIARAAQRAGRQPGEITLVAVSKTFPAARIAEAYAAGQRAFGENFAQEAVEKITKLGGLPLQERAAQGARAKNGVGSDARVHPDPGASPEARLLLLPEWHFIGPIQSNKTGMIAPYFDWVHSLERERIAQRLNSGRQEAMPPLSVCIQVNVSGESTKRGVNPGEEEALAAAIARLPRLKLRGLMAIPEPTSDSSLRRRRFALLRERKEKLAARGYVLDVLSMGMSDDFEDAIAEGATMVRIGTAIFGERKKN
jgi:PLP dependent protein